MGYKHKKILVWGNIEELNKLILEKLLPLIPKTNYKLRDQIDRANSSIGANFIEGYYSGSTKEYIKFLGYSRRSLAEMEFWIDHCRMKRFFPENLFLTAKDLTIRTCYLMDRLTQSLIKKTSSSFPSIPSSPSCSSSASSSPSSSNNLSF